MAIYKEIIPSMNFLYLKGSKSFRRILPVNEFDVDFCETDFCAKFSISKLWYESCLQKALLYLYVIILQTTLAFLIVWPWRISVNKFFENSKSRITSKFTWDCCRLWCDVLLMIWSNMHSIKNLPNWAIF